MKIQTHGNTIVQNELKDVLYRGKIRHLAGAVALTAGRITATEIDDEFYSVCQHEVFDVVEDSQLGISFLVPAFERDLLIPIATSEIAEMRQAELSGSPLGIATIEWFEPGQAVEVK